MSDAFFEPVAFSDIAGWQGDDHVAAMAAFRISAARMAKRPYSTKRIGAESALLATAAARALALTEAEQTDGHACRNFFEAWFTPHRLRLRGRAPDPHDGSFGGLVTGYFEPEIEASRERSAAFPVPILRRPPDLVEIDDASRPPDMAADFFFARKTASGLTEYHDRAAIENGALDGLGLELFWCKSRIELFFVQIQGSARLRLPDGSTERISYDGKTGHPFTAIGRLLVEHGELDAETVSMQKIRAWLETFSNEAPGLMQENQSYIFFQTINHPKPELGPVAAAGVPLTPMRSLAVDHRLHTFGTPVFVETEKPLPRHEVPFASLMIAQDTGSAIVGPARGDLFIGSGEKAGEIAGAIKHPAHFTVLLPRPGSG